MFLKKIPKKYYILIVLLNGIFTVIFLIVAVYLTRTGFFSTRRFDDINQKILTYLEQCDATSFEAVASPGYVKRLSSNGTLSLDTCEKLKQKKCDSIVISGRIDNSSVQKEYENERLFEEYVGNIYCDDKALYIEVKINDKRELISLRIV